MKHKILVLGMLMTTIAMTGCASGQDGKDAVVQETVQKLPVEVEAIEKKEIVEEFYSLGSVEPGRTYSMTALVSAEVKNVYVSVGDVVKAGDLLFELETKDFQTSRISQISGAKTQLDNAKIQKDSALKTYTDTKILFDQGAVSKSTLDQTKDALDTAEINYRNVNTTYDTTISSLSSTEESYIVTSPIDGIVTSRDVEVGQYASSSNGITISEYDSVKITISIPSARIDEAYVGQPVHIEFPTQEFEVVGELATLNSAGKTGGFPAEIILSNEEGKLLPGMIAEVYLETARDDNAIVVEKNVVLEDEMGAYVYIADNDTAKRIDVETGLKNGKYIQIIGGISEGDFLVVKGQQYLEDKDQILVK